jgi:hypothetical protein
MSSPTTSSVNVVDNRHDTDPDRFELADESPDTPERRQGVLFVGLDDRR